MAAHTSSPDDIRLQRADVDPVQQFLSQHHTAMLVVMFTDLKGSTELAEQRGEVYSQNVRLRHDELLRTIIERDGAGRCIKTIGDSLMCIFAQPSLAVDRALEIQRRLAEYNADHPQDEPLRVRIGMHLGQVMLQDEVQVDVFGRHVNRAARVEALAEAGQVLLTFPVYDSAKGWLSAQGHAWRDHGYYRLKGIDEPTRILEVYRQDGPGPRTPVGNRIRQRSWIAWTAAIVAFALAGIAVWHSLRVVPPLEPSLELNVLRNDEVYVDLADVLPLQSGDHLQLVGSSNRAAYVTLVWIDQNGDAQVVATSGDQRIQSIRFPEAPEEWVPLEGGSATEMAILLVDEDRPIHGIPPSLQELTAGKPLPVLGEPFEVIAIQADRQGQTEIEASGGVRGLGEVQRQDVDNLRFHVSRVREVLKEDVDGFQAWVLPHR